MGMNGQPARLILKLECALDASCGRVFKALTEPTALAQWWGPSGFTTPAIEIDLRVGGRYRFSMQPPDGDLFHLSGQYLEIDPPNRLTYTFRWEEPDPDDTETVVRLFLVTVGDGSRLRLLQGNFATDERLALHRSGWTDSFAKLRDLFPIGG